MERFWSKVDKNGPIPQHVPELGNCWLWTAAKYKTGGYGKFSILSIPVKAHRFSFELHFGEIPNGLFVCHKCDSRLCVRPDHLFLGSNTDNMRDMVYKNRNVPRSPLTREIVREIREQSGYKTQEELMQDFNINKLQVYKILFYKTWKF